MGRDQGLRKKNLAELEAEAIGGQWQWSRWEMTVMMTRTRAPTQVLEGKGEEEAQRPQAVTGGTVCLSEVAGRGKKEKGG